MRSARPRCNAIRSCYKIRRRHYHNDNNNTDIVDEKIAYRLVTKQFDQWQDSIRPVRPGGHDNKTYRLGEHKLLRFPSKREYAAQVEKEQLLLPRLRPSLPLDVPEPIGLGEPGCGYPYRWSIYRWLEGEALSSVPMPISQQERLAKTLAKFLMALHRIDTTAGLAPGPHNFYRGGSLLVYDNETREALNRLRDRINADYAIHVWEEGLRSRWRKDPVWVHGDMKTDNLLVRGNQGSKELAAVIDFGMLAVGDPACDLSMYWTFFEGNARRVFRDTLILDEDTWKRARAWTLWKALIIEAQMSKTNSSEERSSRCVIDTIVNE